MKKQLTILLAVLLVLALGACAAPSATPSQPPAGQSAQPIRIAGLTGPTTMGLVKLLDDAKNGLTQNQYDFLLAGSADELTPKLVKGDLDIAMVPANLASVLYNNTDGQVQLLAINTLGVMYIVEQGESVSSIADLKGKTIYATGKGSTPEYVLSYVFKEHGLDPENDVDIQWMSEPTEVVATMGQNPGTVAMLPQPYVTVAQSNIEGLRIAIDLNQAWEQLDNGSALLTGVAVVRRDFALANPDAIGAFLREYEQSAAFANAQVEQTALLVEEYNIVKAPIAQKAIPYCNITFIAGEEMQTVMDGYLKVLYDQNEKSIGGKMPEADFYYQAG